MSITNARNTGVSNTSQAVDEAEIKRRLDFADAALGAGGHQVTDPVLRELRRRASRGDMTTDEAIAAGVAHIDSRDE